MKTYKAYIAYINNVYNIYNNVYVIVYFGFKVLKICCQTFSAISK